MPPEQAPSSTDVQQIVVWPRETWSPAEARRVAEHRAHLHRELFALADMAEREERNLTVEERDRFTALQDEFDRLS